VDSAERGKLILESIIDEAQEIGASMTALTGSVERFIAITGSTAGVGVTLGLFQRQHAVLVALPIVLAILYIFVVQIYTDSATLAGHKRYLETVINEVVGCDFMLARTHVAPRHDRRPSPVMSTILSLMVLICLSAVSIWADFRYYPDGGKLLVVRIGLIALLVYCAVTIAQAVREYIAAEGQAYKSASEADLTATLRALL
jgi:hypothetical protein